MNTTPPTVLEPFASRVHGAAAVAAPLLLLASTVAFATVGGGINDGVLGGTIGVWSCFAFVIALVGICRLLEPAAPRAAALLTVLAVIGFSAGVAFNLQAVHLALFGEEVLETPLEGADAVSILALLPWGLFAPLSLVLIGIALWRTRAVARWSAALLALGGVLFVLSRPERIEAFAVVADLVLVLALAPIGRRMMTARREAAVEERVP
jgi:uncharacterized membrane protein YgdD (TMEM256/DUF423 family)